MESSEEFSKYYEAFAQRMKMAGLKPHHKIAIALSGGADSMALCILAAHWKHVELGRDAKIGQCISGLRCFIVDHGLRSESSEEARLVQTWVSVLGIYCEILQCKWPNGPPKQGDLQEAARNARYKLLMDKCKEYQFGALLVAHHADDQAELLVLRLSRSSGVIGLAGMAFMSQLFYSRSMNLSSISGDQVYGSVLLIRPLLSFCKDDLYKVCKIAGKKWVEDPTNQKMAFVRNRIRRALICIGSFDFKKEVQELLSSCRKIRQTVESTCDYLIKETVTVHEKFGYITVDVQKLFSSPVSNLCLSRYMTLLLQFVSQKDKPIRGSAIEVMIDYIHKFPCRGSLTVGGCYISPLPGSKALKIVICFSSESRQPTLFQRLDSVCETGKMHSFAEVEEIINASKVSIANFRNEEVELPFSNLNKSDDILAEARKRNLISELTMSSLLSLKDETARDFYAKQKLDASNLRLENNDEKSSMNHPTLYFGKSGYYMNRFVISWGDIKLSNGHDICKYSAQCNSLHSESYSTNEMKHKCKSCPVKANMSASIRHMKESDWHNLHAFTKSNQSSKCSVSLNFKKNLLTVQSTETDETRSICAEHLISRAQETLAILKTIPAPARKGLPVLVNGEGCLLGIPSIAFTCCPLITMSSIFWPRIPLGGGHTSWI